MKKVIIFGDRDFAQMANSYFAYSDNIEVKGFTVEKAYLKEKSFCGKPVVAFEQLERFFPCFSHYLFAPIADSKVRERIYLAGRKAGYRFVSYISPKATNYCKEIGENCFIQEDNTIQFFTKIGNNVILWAGNHIGHHSVIEDEVTITSHVVVSGHCKIGKHAYIGVNATIRDGVTIGENTTVGMGALVTKDTVPGLTYIGAPAKPYVQEARPNN